MTVTLKQSIMVKPTASSPSPTPHHLKLSVWDQSGTLNHVPTIYFYKPSQTNQTPILETLRASLGRALLHFYPLAGRLHRINGCRLELNCNGAGAPLFDAESEKRLADFGDFSPTPLFETLVPSVDYKTPIHDMPLLLVQLTRFSCGGIGLGIAVSHIVADGKSAARFVQEWARMARGFEIVDVPLFDRGVMESIKQPFENHETFHHLEFEEPVRLLNQSSVESERLKKTTTCMLVLTDTQVRNLKSLANETHSNANSTEGYCNYSRYEVVTAHIWRSICEAREHMKNQPTGLCVAVDFRTRVHPPIPESYFGNAVADVIATGVSDELIKNSLGFAARKIREAIKRVSHEYVCSAMAFLEAQQDLSIFQAFHGGDGGDEEVFHGNPNLGVTSWMRLEMGDVDFGWGKEIYFGPGMHDFDGDMLILPGRGGDGSMVVAACLQVKHMESFKRIFYRDV